ncbi:ras-related and estrogen-regulated growth inhibitor isoform X4 [Salmo salar]|uniref:Large ribosomal subunit protein bL21m n=1 Tax=Salmo salar TaxID=8030 RepID=B5X7I5_SALSA|nr:ras-related and estrogen-regulated growth inhibitor isoform X4 [Salmo salar]ACI66805.1 39S ribosomal protein L21, mitochondrial precursor [Salmo salar]|eukprot:XP_014030531.1 PREDICTED: 39S ribosomal protein L21, mitochondrial-like isoform X1 [Salmo salar]
MALTLRNGYLEMLRTCWRLQSHMKIPVLNQMARHQSSQSIKLPSSYVPQTSLSRPLWPEMSYISRDEEERQHKVVLENVNTVLAKEDYGRLFAVVHFASRQWKVTNEDLILIENRIDAECGDQIRLEKVLLVGGEEFTLIGRPLLGRDLVRVEATVIEKTESWPKVHMRFWKRHRYQKKRIIVQPQTVLRINTIEVAPRFT